MNNKLLTEHFFYDLPEILASLKHRKVCDENFTEYLRQSLQNSLNRGYILTKKLEEPKNG